MMATKQRYGKLGGNVDDHGCQSFKTGEVTPEEAHEIGLETARRMWDSDYKIVVTMHLNTDKLHNHIVVNSVLFRIGRRVGYHWSDHYNAIMESRSCKIPLLTFSDSSKYSSCCVTSFWSCNLCDDEI